MKRHFWLHRVLLVALVLGYGPARAAAEKPLEPYGGLGFGNDFAAITPSNRHLVGGRRGTYSGMAPETGELTGLIFQLASNVNKYEQSLRQKSAGIGPIEVGWEFTRGDARLPDDGGDVVSRPGEVLASGTLVHVRSDGGANGDSRRYHEIRFTHPISVMAGAYYHLRLTNLDPDPERNYVSINNAFLRTGEAVRTIPPYGLDPPRVQGPVGGDARTFSLMEREGMPDRYNRIREAIPVFTWIYGDGPGERKIGAGYFFAHRDLRNAALVGGNDRLRQRWRHTLADMPLRELWLYAHWPLAAGRPESDLVVTLVEEPGDWGEGWSMTFHLPAASLADPADRDAATVNGWSEGNDGTFVDWTRLDLAGSNLPIVRSGRVYTIELSSDDAVRPYKLHPSLSVNSGAQVYDSPLATVNQWRDDPQRPGELAFAQRSIDGGRTWTGFSLFGQGDRRDISLPIWFARG